MTVPVGQVNRSGRPSVTSHMTRTRLLLAAVPVSLLLAACGSSSSVGSGTPSAVAPTSAAGSTGAPAAGAATTYTVAQYTLPALTVAPGTTVRVLDGDDEPHTVTADDRSFDTGSLDKTHPGTFTAPSKPGSYAIHCTVHPSMHGTITVR